MLRLHHPCAHLLCSLLLLLPVLLPPHHVWAARCGAKDIPRVSQVQVGLGQPPEFTVTVQNSCPMCPAIGIHVKCGGFPQSLVRPRVLRVVGFDDCVVNAGLPLGPLQTFSFNYTHQRLPMAPRSCYFQCE